MTAAFMIKSPGRAVATALVLSWGIVTIPAADASGADTASISASAACRTSDAALANFVAVDPPGPVAATPFQDRDGNAVNIPQLAAKRGAVVNFWATWCAPCVREMPHLDALKHELDSDGIPVLAVSQDRGGLKRVEPFYKKHGYEHLEIHLDKGGKFARSLKVRGLPTTILFDHKGREVLRVQGIAEWHAPKVVAFIRGCLPPVATGAG